MELLTARNVENFHTETWALPRRQIIIREIEFEHKTTRVMIYWHKFHQHGRTKIRLRHEVFETGISASCGFGILMLFLDLPSQEQEIPPDQTPHDF